MKHSGPKRLGVRSTPTVAPLSRGAIVVELIIALPVMAIFLAAVVEFGLILVGVQQVALASRTGAKVAAESAGLNVGGGSPAVATSVKSAVDRVLAAGGIGVAGGTGNSCTVQLRHNVPGDAGLYTAGGSCPCNSPTSNTPASPPFYVRVTVCVELSKLSPNLLNTFGFSTANKYVEHTTTYPYEPAP
jgi:hypothetical protein